MAHILSTINTRLKTVLSRIWTYAKVHKVISAILVIALIGAGYFTYTNVFAGKGTTEYVLATATQGPLQVTVTGSGQVSAQNDLNLVPQASGQIVKLNAKAGQQVKAGTIVAELDMTTAAEAVTTAKQDLASAEISYQQELASSNTSISSDQSAVQTDQTNTLNAVSTTYTNIAPVMTGLDSNLHTFSTISGYGSFENVDAYAQFINTATAHQYHDQVVADYNAAVAAYQKTQAEFANAQPSSLSVEQTESLAQDTLASLQDINIALKDTLTYYNYISQQIQRGNIVAPTQIASQISTVTGYQSTITSDISNVNSANTTLAKDEQTLKNDTNNAGSGSTPLAVQSAELGVQKAQEALAQAETNESNYIVRAPFDGIIATVPVNLYDQASSGTTVATLITNEEYVDLSLNETDVAKVQVGQPVVMTFEALPNVTMNGSVAEIDPVGTVSSGVVTYTVKIGFDQQNSQIKPGMTVDATIVTNSVADAIQVPTAAIQAIGNRSFVQVAKLRNASSTSATGGATASSTRRFNRQITESASNIAITRVPVVLGVSNGTMTQIVSGITPGEYIVTATQTASSNSTKSSAASATSLLSGNRAGGFTGGGNFGGGTRTFTSGGTSGGGAAAGK